MTSECRLRIGIISGSGPEAGVDLWSKLLEENRELLGTAFSGDLDAPYVIILSEPRLGLSMHLETHEEEVWSQLETALRTLACQVDLIAIACNTLHYFEARIGSLRLPARLVSLSDVLSDYVRAQGLRQVALLGARPVMELGRWSPYRRLGALVSIERPRDSDAVHRLILDIKRLGPTDGLVATRFSTLLETLQSRTVVLACTELPLIAVQAVGRQLVDMNRLLARALVVASLDSSCAPITARPSCNGALAQP
ncbi:aspartate/glutamate racemase family protein [Virgifigura deserti]|uniref:aspartate/glutamate racemase family protein n=1 Tax=Virgifigura deserti TaxID=2268457 RepID=UPI003CCBDF4B